MELEESVTSIIYIFFFAAFITIMMHQSELFTTTVTGLDTLSEFQTDLINDFVYSPCFIAKNKQGNNIHGVFDEELLDSHTTRKQLSEIISLTPTLVKYPTLIDYPLNYAPTIADCVNTVDNHYYYEIRLNKTPNKIWLFGNGSRLGFIYDKTWTHGKKPITIKRGNTMATGIIIYGFSKNPAKAGNPFTVTLPGISTPTTCESLGGITCATGERCGGTTTDLYALDITIPTTPTATGDDSSSLDDYDLYRPGGTGTPHATCPTDVTDPNIFGIFDITKALGTDLDEDRTMGRTAFYMFSDGSVHDNNDICFTTATEYLKKTGTITYTPDGRGTIPAGAYHCNEHNLVTTKTCVYGCSPTNPGYCAGAPPSTTTPTPPTTGGISSICCFDGTCV